MIADTIEGAGQLQAALEECSAEQRAAVMKDPAFRVTVDDAVRELVTGKVSGISVDHNTALLALAQMLRTERQHGAGHHLMPLACGVEGKTKFLDGYSTWVWRQNRLTIDPLGDAFLKQFQYYHPNFQPVTPDLAVGATLDRGARLLKEVVPSLSDSALSHAQVVIVIMEPSKTFSSMTNPLIPGMVALSPLVLNSPWRAAEFILHEAVHTKFIDLEHTHSVLAREYRSESSAIIEPFWHANTDHAAKWPIGRSLTACHVYTCLAIFFANAAIRKETLSSHYGRVSGPAMQQAEQALSRAQFLCREIAKLPSYLGNCGVLFTEWLDSIHCCLAPMLKSS